MTTVLLWLLVSVAGASGVSSSVPTVTVARFADLDECERVRRELMRDHWRQALRCVQARVVKD